MLVIIFLLIKKPYHVHVSWCALGRKLPTAYTSQQLLRWLWPKRYIFSIFWRLKNSKKLLAQLSKTTVRWQLETINFQMLHVRKSWQLLDTSNSCLECHKCRTCRHVLAARFWTCQDLLPKLEKLRFLRNPEKSKNLQKSAKSAKSTKPRKVAKSCDSGGLCRVHAKPQKIEKNRKFSDFRKIAKNRKNRKISKFLTIRTIRTLASGAPTFVSGAHFGPWKKSTKMCCVP